MIGLRKLLMRRRVVRLIDRQGWGIGYVEIPGILGFGYSVGFWETAKAPDLIFFGATPDAAVNILAAAYEDLHSGALVAGDMARWDAGGDVVLVLREVHPTQLRQAFFEGAIWYHGRKGGRRKDFRALQVVWPDTHGVFPWERGYDQAYRPVQFALWEPFPGDAPDENSLLATLVPDPSKDI